MTTVRELVPGDLVENAGLHAVYVEQAPHPIYPGLRLVIWRLGAGTGRWSHDALSADQYVGQALPADHDARQQRLRDALLGPEGAQ